MIKSIKLDSLLKKRIIFICYKKYLPDVMAHRGNRREKENAHMMSE